MQQRPSYPANSQQQQPARRERGPTVPRYRGASYREEDYYEREDWGQVIRAVSDRMEELRNQYQVISDKLGTMQVAFERLSASAISRTDLDSKVDKPYFMQAQEAQRERDTRLEAAISGLQTNQQVLLDCPRRLDKLENAPQRWAPWVAIGLSALTLVFFIISIKLP